MNMQQPKTLPIYTAYILRMWCEEEQWFYQLKSISENQQWRFVTFAELIQFLAAQQAVVIKEIAQ